MSLPLKLHVWVDWTLRWVRHAFWKVLFLFRAHIPQPLKSVQILWTQVHKYCIPKHNSFKFRWTKGFSKASGKELAMDNSFAFEKQQWTCKPPVIAVRFRGTIDAMSRIEEIKQTPSKFIMNRLKKTEELHREDHNFLAESREAKRSCHLGPLCMQSAKENNWETKGTEITTGCGHWSCFWISYCL